MKNKYKLPQRVLDTLSDIGYTSEVIEDHLIDKLIPGARKHLSHLRGQLKELQKMIITETKTA